VSHLVYLIRHAIAEEATGGMSDAERALTSEGRKRMKEVAQGLNALGVAPTAILSSPLKRAMETAEIVRDGIDFEGKVTTFDPLANGHTPEEVIRTLPRRTAVLALVGHQPSLGELASYLLTGSQGLVPLPFKKGGVAAITLASIPPRVPGTLEWFLTPKQLRAIAGSR
jgi:phosphohistidine phosphatase